MSKSTPDRLLGQNTALWTVLGGQIVHADPKAAKLFKVTKHGKRSLDSDEDEDEEEADDLWHPSALATAAELDAHPLFHRQAASGRSPVIRGLTDSTSHCGCPH